MKNQGWPDQHGCQEKMEVRTYMDSPPLSVDVQYPHHALHECMHLLFMQHQLCRYIDPCSKQVQSLEWKNTRQCHYEDDQNTKMEIEEQNICDEVWDSQPTLHKNWKERCWEVVTVQQMCVITLQNHSAVVELFDKGTIESHL